MKLKKASPANADLAEFGNKGWDYMSILMLHATSL
jgi:hypothetical protein